MKIGLVDFYLDEWHANHYPQMLHDCSGGEIEAVYAYGRIASPLTGVTSAQWCCRYGLTLCPTIEEVVEKSDGIIVLSPDNCEMHVDLCRIPLASGKPVYVDKTFAPDLASAKRIFAMAEAGGSPVYSSSALRFATEYADVNRADITAINSWGPMDYETYSIHQLEPMMMLMGADASRVQFSASENWYQLLIAFADGRFGTISGFRNGSPFLMNIAGREKSQVIEVKSAYFHNFMMELVDFFRTRTVKVPHCDTLRIMAVREAGLRAAACPGQWVEVPSV